MPTNAKVAIELYVDDKGTLRVREFKQEAKDAFDDVEKSGSGAAGKIGAAWESVKTVWIGVIAMIMGLREAWGLMNTAAKAREQEASFASLAASYGSNGDKIIAELKRVSVGTIDTMTLIKNAGTAMMMGIAPDDVIKLMEIAKATAKMTGQATVTAFEDISLAVGRQSKMILDNLGIIIDVEKANDEYAKVLHKTSTQLNDAERKQAFMNATMKAGGELMAKLGVQADTMSDRLERYKATIEDLKVGFGDFLLRVFNGFETLANSLGSVLWVPISYLERIVQGVSVLTDKLHLSSGATEIWGKRAEEAFRTYTTMNTQANQAFKDMFASGNALQNSYKKTIEEATKALQEQEKVRQKILDNHKDDAEQQADAEREMYEEAGMGAEKYFSAEATELVKKAARWKAAGADTYQTEQWLYEQIGKLSEDAWAKGETAAGQAMDAMQNMTETLIEQYNAANTSIVDQLTAVGLKVDELDGQNIGLTASFDGGMVVTGIDALIAKFQAMRTAASSAAAASAGAMTSSDSSLSISSSSSDQSSSSSTSSSTDTASGGSAKSLIVNNFNQQISRSDVNAITSEQARTAGRM